MTKKRYLEQLNLFLDDELPLEERDELRRAIHSSPEFFAIYRQYCMINEACSRLGADFLEQPQKRSARQMFYAASGMAAAVALLALAATNLSPLFTDSSQPGLAAQGEGSLEVASSDEFQSVDMDAASREPGFENRFAADPLGNAQVASFEIDASERIELQRQKGTPFDTATVVAARESLLESGSVSIGSAQNGEAFVERPFFRSPSSSESDLYRSAFSAVKPSASTIPAGE